MDKFSYMQGYFKVAEYGDGQYQYTGQTARAAMGGQVPGSLQGADKSTQDRYWNTLAASTNAELNKGLLYKARSDEMFRRLGTTAAGAGVGTALGALFDNPLLGGAIGALAGFLMDVFGIGAPDAWKMVFDHHAQGTLNKLSAQAATEAKQKGIEVSQAVQEIVHGDLDSRVAEGAARNILDDPAATAEDKERATAELGRIETERKSRVGRDANNPNLDHEISEAAQALHARDKENVRPEVSDVVEGMDKDPWLATNQADAILDNPDSSQEEKRLATHVKRVAEQNALERTLEKSVPRPNQGNPLWRAARWVEGAFTDTGRPLSNNRFGLGRLGGGRIMNDPQAQADVDYTARRYLATARQQVKEYEQKFGVGSRQALAAQAKYDQGMKWYRAGGSVIGGEEFQAPENRYVALDRHTKIDQAAKQVREQNPLHASMDAANRDGYTDPDGKPDEGTKPEGDVPTPAPSPGKVPPTEQ